MEKILIDFADYFKKNEINPTEKIVKNISLEAEVNS